MAIGGLALVLGICLYTDLKERKIYNKVVFPAIVIGLLYNFYSGGITGGLFALKGLGLGLAIFFIPFALGGLGAGDVKLMGAIGAIMGSEFVLYSAVATALFGGLIALGIIIYKGQYSLGFPYGVPIALGVLMAYLVLWKL